MDKIETVILKGCSGNSYPFTALPIGAPLAAAGVVYAILRDGPAESLWARRSVVDFGNHHGTGNSQWTILYIGQAEDLRARFGNAQEDLELARIRATHLAVHGAESESRRRSIESDLVPRYASLIRQPRRHHRKHLVESITIAYGEPDPPLG